MSKNLWLICLWTTFNAMIMATLMYLGGAPERIIVCALILFIASAGCATIWNHAETTTDSHSQGATF